MFEDKLTILDEADLIAIFGSISEMRYHIECIVMRQSFSNLAELESSPEHCTPLKLNEIF